MIADVRADLADAAALAVTDYADGPMVDAGEVPRRQGGRTGTSRSVTRAQAGEEAFAVGVALQVLEQVVGGQVLVEQVEQQGVVKGQSAELIEEEDFEQVSIAPPLRSQRRPEQSKDPGALGGSLLVAQGSSHFALRMTSYDVCPTPTHSNQLRLQTPRRPAIRLRRPPIR